MALQKVKDSMRTTTALDSTKLSGAVPTAALSNVDLVEGTKGADIASSSTMVIGTDGGYFDITGTTGISTMTVAAGRAFTLQFDGAVVLTNSSTLKLSGAANFTTAAGDHLTFVSVAANDVRQVGFGLTDGGSPVTPAGGENNHTSFVRGFSGYNQNTSIASSTMTVVEFSAETFDSDGDFNTTTDRYVVPANGYYLITGAVIYLSLSNGVLITANIFINGAFKSSAANPISTNAFTSCSVTDIYYCTTGQYIQLYTWHTKGSAASFDFDGWGGGGPYGSGNYLSVARIG